MVLVRALVNRGQVGPATNIGTDYHLLEAQGIVMVDGPPGGRAFLRMVKPEIVKDGLDWLERTTVGRTGGSDSPKLLQSPRVFLTPEQDRAALGDQGAADEVDAVDAPPTAEGGAECHPPRPRHLMSLPRAMSSRRA